MIHYVTIEEVLIIRDGVMEQSEGRKGILDFTMLHSAIERPKATFDGKELYPGIFEKASALVHSLIRNHPFNDGNKRTGLAITAWFLRQNGWKLVAPEDDLIQFTLDIQKKHVAFEHVASWLQVHTVPLTK